MTMHSEEKVKTLFKASELGKELEQVNKWIKICDIAQFF